MSCNSLIIILYKKIFVYYFNIYFLEAQRVQKFVETCKDKSSGENTLITLGNLMTKSHESLKDLYECSHPQLDR